LDTPSAASACDGLSAFGLKGDSEGPGDAELRSWSSSALGADKVGLGVPLSPIAAICAGPTCDGRIA
jgi:hypothetical protein